MREMVRICHMFDETLSVLALLLALRAFQDCHRGSRDFWFLLLRRVMFMGSNVSVQRHLVLVIISTHFALEIKSLYTYLIIFHLLLVSCSAFLCISLIYVTCKNMLIRDYFATLTFIVTFLKLTLELNFLLRLFGTVFLFTTFYQSLR